MLMAGLALFNVNHSSVLRSRGEQSSNLCTYDFTPTEVKIVFQ